MSVRALAKEMQERFPNLRGTSYGGIRLYTEDGKVTNPRVELLRAIAEVLEVRPDWLAFDNGPMTEREMRALEAERDAAQLPTVTDYIAAEAPEFADLSPVVQAVVVNTAMRWAGVDSPRFPFSAEGSGPTVMAAKEVLDALKRPLEAWGLSLNSMEPPRQADYCIAMAHALALSAPLPDELPPDDEWTGDGPDSDSAMSEELQRINETIREIRRDHDEEETDG